MKHRIGFNDLSRSSSQRKALKRGLVTSLFRYERIETTNAKALEVRRMAEKMITRAKVDNVHNRRMIARDIYDEAVTAKLFTEIAPLYADRNGGYTRIIKTTNRLGDAAEMVILELVVKTEKNTKKKEAPKKAEKAEKKETSKEENAESATKQAAPKRAPSKVKGAKAVSGGAKTAVRKTSGNANKNVGK